MLTKKIIIDRIEVTENGIIQVRTATRIIEDGVQLSQTYHRHCLSPGDDLIEQDAKVAAIAKAAWTKEVISEFRKKQKLQSVS
jgi:hypothetical protein